MVVREAIAAREARASREHPIREAPADSEACPADLDRAELAAIREALVECREDRTREASPEDRTAATRESPEDRTAATREASRAARTVETREASAAEASLACRTWVASRADRTAARLLDKPIFSHLGPSRVRSVAIAHAQCRETRLPASRRVIVAEEWPFHELRVSHVICR